MKNSCHHHANFGINDLTNYWEDPSFIQEITGNNDGITGLGYLKQGNYTVVVRACSSDNEGICDIRVKYSQSIKPSKNHMSRIVSMIDEIPIFAVVSCFVNGITSVNNSKELRIKESDRISSLCSHFSSAGVMIKELSDGFIINPDKKLYNTIKINSQDHRIIMACEVFNLIIGSGLSSKYENEVSISFPDFYNILKELQK